MSKTNILKLILEDKQQHVQMRKQVRPVAELKEQISQGGLPRPFKGRIVKAVKAKQTALIAEVKKASPSKGIIRNDFDPPSLAIAYQEGGATCLSVLTDMNHFSGKDEYIADIKELCPLPILRKDFIFDPYQVYESRAIGADAILLIQAILSVGQVKLLSKLAKDLGMDVLLEVHNQKEVEQALETEVELVGINNRNLKTFETSLENTITLAPKLRKRKKIVVCESGINTAADIQKIKKEAKTYSFLVGEALMRQRDVETATLNLLRGK